MPLSPDFLSALDKILPGQVRTDPVTRILYSTDASIYQVEPLGVVFPRNTEDLAAVVDLSAQHGVPILPRGSGSSLAGQAIGQALILDCSRFLNRILEINPDECTALVEPGVILNALNRATASYGLQFGPDPASSERATLGGSIANNATGAHSILYGMTADHLLSAEVVLADGTIAELGVEEISSQYTEEQYTVGQYSGDQSERRGRGGISQDIKANLYKTALEIRESYAEAIREHWPRTWRCASGYNLNYLIPWSASRPPQWVGQGGQLPYPPVPEGKINLAALLAGSEGTLGVIRNARLRLVNRPKHTVLGVLAFPGISEACDAVPEILERRPSAIELVPKDLIGLARTIPAYCHLISVLDPLRGDGGESQDVLVVEFAGEDLPHLLDQARALGPETLVAESVEAQKQIWAVRKVGMGIFMSRPGDTKPVAFIEDLSVPVESLGQFVREMNHILVEHKTTADFYAHASAGCLHIRPLLNLKSNNGLSNLRSIASESVNLALSLGGTASGEHGDGLARSEWLERTFGTKILEAFRTLKRAADPQGILNPGKIVDAGPMDEQLRYEKGYAAQAWQPALDFSLREDRESIQLKGAEGVIAAIEHCNGAGVCRKSEGVMCPSFQATQEEMHSTRGRANLLRAMISGAFAEKEQGEQAVREALDLCLACKGCKAECPSAVDMAKLKYEFMDHYYSTHRRRLRDYLFGYIGFVARLGSPFSRLVNFFLSNSWVSLLGERFLGLSARRPFPLFARRSLHSLLRHADSSHSPASPTVLFLSDAFTEYFHPQAGLDAVRVLRACGYKVRILPELGAGRTLISKGFLRAARQHAEKVLDAIDRLDPEGIFPVVGVEPSEIYTLRDEYLDLFPGDEGRRYQAKTLTERAWMIDEFLVRPAVDGKPRLEHVNRVGRVKTINYPSVLLHGHCYQKAQPPAVDGYPVGTAATIQMLKMVGCQVQLIDSTCCGMAGAFGYEAEHYALSMQVGELGLLPAIRNAKPESIIAASGVSCLAQISDGTQREAVHPISLVANQTEIV